MPIFIPVTTGYLNLDRVDFYKQKGRHDWVLYAGEETYEPNSDPERMIVQIIPCTTPMQVVQVHEIDPNMPCEFIWEPVIGWGLSLMGETVPLTPNDLNGPPDNWDWGLREPNSPEITVPFDGTYANEAEWGAAHKRRQADVREIQAAHDRKKAEKAKTG